MEKHSTADHVINHYEPKAGIRTAAGVLSSLFSMGLPVALCEVWRAGGDIKVAMWGGLATVIAIVLAVISIRGTTQE